jgi:hypothetical protein
LRQFLGDGQTQTGATVLARGGVVGLLEGGEQSWQNRRVDTNALVFSTSKRSSAMSAADANN